MGVPAGWLSDQKERYWNLLSTLLRERAVDLSHEGDADGHIEEYWDSHRAPDESLWAAYGGAMDRTIAQWIRDRQADAIDRRT
jgi:hypothetical protein